MADIDDEGYEDGNIFEDAPSDSISDSINETWIQFKDDLQEHWDLFCEDPVEYVKEYIEMLLENKTKIFYVCIAVLAFIFFACGNTSNSRQINLVQQRFIDVSGQIKHIVGEISPTSVKNLHRSLSLAARRLTGFDEFSNVPKHPIVLLFAHSNQTQMDSFIKKISAIFGKSEIFIIEFDCNQTIGRVDFEKAIFSQLRNRQDKHKLLILNNIDRLSSTTPLVIHSIADHENSPFKDLVMIATITLEKELTDNTDTKNCDKLITDRFLESWTSDDLLPDQIYPIASRIAASPTCFNF